MINIDSLKEIKNKTRLSLPKDDEYLFRLGVALYGFNSLNSFVVEIICHIDSMKKQSELISMESGTIIKIFNTMKDLGPYKRLEPIHPLMEKAIRGFEILKNERNDFIHSYPITNKKNEQILHRRLDRKQKYFEVDNLFLESFISRLEEVSESLYRVRKIIKPNL